MAPIVDQKEQATEYLKKYRILQLFEVLTNWVVVLYSQLGLTFKPRKAYALS